MPKKLNIYKVKDKAESYGKDKGLLPNIPFRMLVVGKSHLSGKTNFTTNILLNQDFYRGDFLGEDIYLVSPSIKIDNKLKLIVKELNIPSSNCFSDYVEEEMETLYEVLEEDYKECIREKKKPSPKLIFFDDLGFTGQLRGKQFGIINKIVCNGRHINLSSIFCLQSITQALKSCRENVSTLIIFNMTNKQLELVEEEHNYLKCKKAFYNMFRELTYDPHSFMVINYSNSRKDMYMNKHFQPVCVCPFQKKCENIELDNIYEKK